MDTSQLPVCFNMTLCVFVPERLELLTKPPISPTLSNNGLYKCTVLSLSFPKLLIPTCESGRDVGWVRGNWTLSSCVLNIRMGGGLANCLHCFHSVFRYSNMATNSSCNMGVNQSVSHIMMQCLPITMLN